MDIDLLRTFLEVYRTRHFGQAADNLFVTQSAVSARIKLLEETLGVPLFTRSRSNIQLTPMGQRFLCYAESIVTTRNRARQDVAAEQEDAVLLAVGGVPSLWDIVLQSWLDCVYAGFTDVHVNAEVTSSEVILRRLLDGTLDLGFFFEAPQEGGLQAVPTMSVPLVLVCSRPGVSVTEALGKDYVLVDWAPPSVSRTPSTIPTCRCPACAWGSGGWRATSCSHRAGRPIWPSPWSRASWPMAAFIVSPGPPSSIAPPVRSTPWAVTVPS